MKGHKTKLPRFDFFGADHRRRSELMTPIFLLDEAVVVVVAVVVVDDVVAATEVMQQSFLSSRKKAFTEKFRKTDDSCKKKFTAGPNFFRRNNFSGLRSAGIKMLRLIDQVRYSMGSGCSTAVQHMPFYRVVVGLNPARCCFFLFLYILSDVHP